MTAGIFSGGIRESRVGAAARTVIALLLLAGAAPVFAAAPEPAGAAGGAPMRIVSLVPAITETLFALELGARVVGVSTYCDFPAEAAKLPKVGTFSEPVAEAIVALRPDLVLTSPSPGNETAVRAIERTGVKVAVVQSEGGIAEARSAMLEVARAAGAGAAGERLVAAIDARLAAIKTRAASVLERPATAIVVGREPVVLAGPASYLGELLVLAGGVNIADRVGGRWPRVGLEFLVSSAPAVLVDLSVSMEERRPGATAPPHSPAADPADAAGPRSVAEDPAKGWKQWSSIPAVANGRVVVDRASLMLRPGPRLADAADALFAALHPAAPATAGPSMPQAPQLEDANQP